MEEEAHIMERRTHTSGNRKPTKWEGEATHGKCGILLQIDFHELIRIKKINYLNLCTLVIQLTNPDILIKEPKDQLGLKQSKFSHKTINRGCFGERQRSRGSLCNSLKKFKTL